VLYYRTPDANDSSKAAEQKPVDVLVTSSVATTSAPPPLAGPGLMACTYNDAMSSTQSVLLYLESLKDVKAGQKGNRLSLTASNYLFFCWLYSSYLCSLVCQAGGSQQGAC
jgi:hypothetical protein